MKPAPTLIATAGLALLAAACTGGPPSADPGGTPGAGGQASSSSAVGYSRCMRSHGVPDFPDPASDAVIPKTSAQQLGISDSRLRTAQNACQHLLPNVTSLQQQARQCLTAGDCPQALVQQMLT